MNENFKKLDTDAEISNETVVSLRSLLLRLSEIQSIVQGLMMNQVNSLFDKELENRNKGKISSSGFLFCQSGIDCEILQPGWSGWKKGKLRVKAYLEFEPDEPEVDQNTLDLKNSQGDEIEFPLDEVRKEIADKL